MSARQNAREITYRDAPLIREWLNCETVFVDDYGFVLVSGPMAGHWLSPGRLDEYRTWRAVQLGPRAKLPPDDRLRAAGEALYGSRWQSDMARALGVGDRRVREWAAGERRTPPGVWIDIAALLRQRREQISALLGKFERGEQ